MNIRPLPKELQCIAEKELHEVPKRTEDDINGIRKWLKGQRHLNARLDDQLLVTFLRGSKFSLERAKERIDKYYTMRTIAPEIFSKRDPSLSPIKYLFDDKILTILPTKVGESVRIVMRPGAINLDFAELQDMTKLYFMLIDILLEENDNCVISGTMILIDFEGFTLKHVLQATIPLMVKSVTALENCYPARLKAVDVIHVPSFAIPICRFVKSLLSKKLRERFSIFEDHIGVSKIYDNFPINILPEEYGGLAGPMQNLAEQWRLKLESYTDWFANEVKYCSDETKRQKASNYFNNIYGLDGSFRKLEVD